MSIFRFAGCHLASVVLFLLPLHLHAYNQCNPMPRGSAQGLVTCVNTLNQLGGGIIDLGGATYVFSSVNNLVDGANALPDIISSITIRNGDIRREPSSTSQFRLLHVSGNLHLSNVILENGSDTASGGGAIYVTSGASLQVQNTNFYNNQSSYAGGAIYLSQNSTITAINNATFFGNSTPQGNGASNSGGAIFVNGNINTISDSTFNENSAALGGVLYVNGQIGTIFNVTFNQNLAGQSGGGLYLNGGSTIGQLYNSTIVGNMAGTQGVGWGAGIQNCGTITDMQSNIVAGNFDPSPVYEDDYNDCGQRSTLTSASYNLIGVNTNNSYFVNGLNNNLVGNSSAPLNPSLGLLLDNGGPTPTMALLSNSIAIGAGSNPLNLAFDQRGPGYARETASQTDIGAYQWRSRRYGAPSDLPGSDRDDQNRIFP